MPEQNPTMIVQVKMIESHSSAAQVETEMNAFLSTLSADLIRGIFTNVVVVADGSVWFMGNIFYLLPVSSMKIQGEMGQ